MCEGDYAISMKAVVLVVDSSTEAFSSKTIAPLQWSRR